MEQNILLQGVILGFSIAAPVGPIGVLCIRRTLTHGRLTGLLTGLGAATADAIYGSVAAFGMGWLSALLVSGQGWLRLVGGLFLVYLGVTTLISRPKGSVMSDKVEPGHLGAYSSALVLTLTNPMTILSFAAIMAGLGAADSGYQSSLSLVCGVFIGSALWWMLLSTLVSLVRRRLSDRVLLWINRLSGAGLCVFAALILSGLLSA